MLFKAMGSNGNKNPMASFPQPQSSGANNWCAVLPFHLYTEELAGIVTGMEILTTFKFMC